MKVYLDNAATTPLDPEVFEAMKPYLMEHYGNPSSTHSHGRQVRSAIEYARKKVAELLHASPGEIFFTSGGTEADNTILCGAVETHGIKHVISTAIEHHAVSHTLENLEKSGKIKLSLLDLDGQGHFDYDQLKQLLQENPHSLVSLMHGNNEVATLHDIAKIGTICEEFGAFFHTDTVQTMGHYPHDLRQLKIGGLVGSAHKFHGPKGIGFMYINKKNKLNPFIHGGAQERNMRGGTENVYGIIGLAKALEIAYRDMAHHERHITELKGYMKQRLEAEIDGILFNGDSGNVAGSLYTVLNASLPESEDNDMLLFNLDINGISASGGSACSSGATKGSHVLGALYPNSKRGAVRFSFSRYTTKEEIDYTVQKLAENFSVPSNA
jgi:cysteine desulfurase